MSRWRRDAHQCLAEIAAFQHADEGGWRILKPVGDVLAIADASIGDRSADSAQERRVVIAGEFVVDVAAQSKTLAQYLTHGRGKKIWSGSGTRGVVLGDQPAHRDAGKLVEQGQHGLPNGAPDIFEIDIDPIGTGSFELFGKVGYPMIDSDIEAKLVDNGAAFFGTAGDADGSCASDFRELPNQ